MQLDAKPITAVPVREEGATNLTDDHIHAARLRVCTAAHDAADARDLMEYLGLLAPQQKLPRRRLK